MRFAISRTFLLLTPALLLALCVRPGAAQQQQGTISGTVTDRVSGTPIPSVRVSLLNTNRSAVTNQQGRFSLQGVPVGTYQVQAAIIGYAEGLDTGLSVAFQEDLDFLLGRLQGSLAMARQFHAALESLQRLLEWQIAALQALHQALELAQRALKVRCIGSLGRCSRIARQESSLKCIECSFVNGAPRYTAGGKPATAMAGSGPAG